MRVAEVFQRFKRLFLDTAPVIYYVERHPKYGVVVDEIFDGIDDGRLPSEDIPSCTAPAGRARIIITAAVSEPDLVSIRPPSHLARRMEDPAVSKNMSGDRLTGRREFLTMLSAAAASGLVGGSALADPPAGTAGPGGSTAPMPTIALGPHRISRLVAGSNPILGYSYMGSHTDQHMKEYFTTEQTVEFLQDCERAGITAHQFSTPDRAGDYLRLLRERGSKLQLICLHSQREKIQEAIEIAKPIAIVHHGGATDRLFAEGNSKRVHDYVKAVKDSGVLAGVSAHNPDCIKQVADEDWEVDFFMTCFYFLTRKIVNKDFSTPNLDIVYPFFKDDPLVMTKVIREVKQPCLGFKILGAGRLCSNQETVRAAFKFAFENIKPTDGVIVGMFPWHFDEVGANTQYTRELGTLKG